MSALLYASILGVIEGLTEFIPVSSTGHLIVAGHLLGFNGPMASTFDLFIQLGAILAVVVLEKERLFRLCSVGKQEGFAGPRGLLLLGVTTLPAVVLGAIAHSVIKDHLFNPMTVAAGLSLGGVGILITERFLPSVRRSSLDSLRWREAFAVGLFQCLALWPGVSRSASTILGGMCVGVERKTAAEYSFLAAVPLLFAAATFDLYKSLQFVHGPDIPIFGLGFAFAFISAWLAVKGFIRLLGSHTLEVFGWYRLAVALVIVWLLA